jgi:hypothetical protein
MKLLLFFLLSISAALAQTTHSVTLTWTWSQGTGGSATGFNVKRATVAGGPYTTVGTAVSTTTNYVDTSGLTEGTKYFYVVTATGPGGESTPSNEASGMIPFSVPNQPATLSIVVK